MADKKKRSQAEKAVSSAKNKGKNTISTPKKNKSPEKNAEKERSIPIRFYSASTFLGLFVLFLVISLNQEGALTGLLCNLLYGMVGVAGFIISIRGML